MTEENYDTETLDVLEGLEAVRKRPSMYIGDVGSGGLHHMVEEVLDNSIDEAMAGHCDRITVTLEDGVVTVEDNGRGIPVAEDDETGLTGVEMVLTKLHAGGKFGQKNYQVSGGLHGVGVSCVNALSEWFEVEVRRDGNIWSQRYEQGIPATELEEKDDTDQTGTTIQFKPDSEIFDATEYNPERIKRRLEELAYLNPGLTLIYKDDDEEKEYFSEDGMKGYLSTMTESKESLHSPFELAGEEEGVQVSISVEYVKDQQTAIHSFVNNIRTANGGTHESGFKRAVTRTIKGKQDDLGYKENIDIKGMDARAGLRAAISVRVPEPQFKGQTKSKLGNQEVQGIVSRIAGNQLEQALSGNKKATKGILRQAAAAVEARQAADKARDLAYSRHKRKKVGDKPEKMRDCKVDSGGELFLCEGDSAGGTAKTARNPETQAVLPLRGKVLNVEKKKLKRILKNNEIQNIIKAMGIGVPGGSDDDQYRPDKLKYDKLVIMTDADPDGFHIECLLLTLFYRYFPELIANGKIYIAETPLYRVKLNGEQKYIYDSEPPEKATGIQRFKGLGEMNPDQLKKTALDPETRRLVRVTAENARWADDVVDGMMGRKTKKRKEVILKHFGDGQE